MFTKIKSQLALRMLSEKRIFQVRKTCIKNTEFSIEMAEMIVIVTKLSFVSLATGFFLTNWCSWVMARPCYKDSNEISKIDYLKKRAIQEVNSVGGPPVDVARVLESRLRWHLAVLFDSMANVKDALHQLCVAVQRHPTDADLTAFYRQYVAKSGVKIQPQLGVQTSQDEAVMHLVDGYLESNDDWSLRHLLTPPVGAVKST